MPDPDTAPSFPPDDQGSTSNPLDEATANIRRGLFVEEYFGQPVSVYTRADALSDGTLVDVSKMASEAGFNIPVALTANLWADVDVSKMASEAGFNIPVALTANLWADVNAIPQTPECSAQDVNGRLWDVLFMAWHNVRVHGNAPGDTLVYELIMPVSGGDERLEARYTVKIVIGPDDDARPCLTLLQPGED